MSREPVVLNTVEDLVAFAVKQGTYDASRTWKLIDSLVQEWDDPAAGKAWEDEKKPQYGTPRREDFWARRPKQHTVRHYRLQRTGDAWQSQWLNMSDALGAQVWEAWPKKQSRYGNYLEPSGCRTLAGLLKLMGNTEVGAAIKTERERIERERTEQHRAAVKAHIEKAARELAEYIVKNEKDTDIRGLSIGNGSVFLLDEHANVVGKLEV